MADVFEALGEPNRRLILESLAMGEQSAGAVVDAVRARARISQPAVSQHLKVLREAGLVAVRVDGTRRIYAVDTVGVEAARSWLHGIANPSHHIDGALDALSTEVARGRRQRRSTSGESHTGAGSGA